MPPTSPWYEPALAVPDGPASQDRGPIPHVIAWNLTRRCNLECAHCYISAGAWQSTAGEMSTLECLHVADQVLAVNPAPLLILTGGEPLLRDDLETIAGHATRRGATVVVGTNGTRLTAQRIASLKAAGVSGVAVSIDSLDPTYHDRFRHGDGALADTMAAVERCREGELDFIVQTSLTSGNRAEMADLVAWSAEAGAVSFNLYFLVRTGRGEGMAPLSPDENEEVLAELVRLEREYRGRIMVRSKCQPQIMRHAHAASEGSPLLSYETRCPCGVQYCRITPEGKVTPCPYIPEVAGDLRRDSFATIWRTSPLLLRMREGRLGGKCGDCEFRGVCGGCRARALADTGDVMGPDDSCAYEPKAGAAATVVPPGATFGSAAEPNLAWTDEALARVARIPSFVRGVVTSRVEDFARRKGSPTVTVELLDAIRQEMPVDFSRRLPFFARRKV